jgi:hypothetical protein
LYLNCQFITDGLQWIKIIYYNDSNSVIELNYFYCINICCGLIRMMGISMRIGEIFCFDMYIWEKNWSVKY